MIDIATRVMLGQTLKELGHHKALRESDDFVAIKVPIFSMEKLRGAEMALSPEMKSTGELMSIDYTLGDAIVKSLIAQGYHTQHRAALISINDKYKVQIEGIVVKLIELGYEIYATKGTHDYLLEKEISTTCVGKLYEASDILDLISKDKLDMVINIPKKGFDSKSDGFRIRREAIERKIPCYTSLETADAVIDSFKSDTGSYNMFDICAL
jgi:carbamoyl-phosphate synthase large subunit